MPHSVDPKMDDDEDEDKDTSGLIGASCWKFSLWAEAAP